MALLEDHRQSLSKEKSNDSADLKGLKKKPAMLLLWSFLDDDGTPLFSAVGRIGKDPAKQQTKLHRLFGWTAAQGHGTNEPCKYVASAQKWVDRSRQYDSHDEREETRVRNLITAHAVKPVDRLNAEHLLSKGTKPKPKGSLDFPYFRELRGTCAPRFFQMPYTKTDAQKLEDAIRNRRSEARQSSTGPAEESSWHLILRYFTFCDDFAVDEKLARDVATIVSAMRGTTVTAFDVIRVKCHSHITEEMLDSDEDSGTGWWRHPSIGIPELGECLRFGAEVMLDQELERRGISIKATYQVEHIVDIFKTALQPVVQVNDPSVRSSLR
ncbi:hypothetical protein EDD37DRAFT_612880 [Exophiala viscosa]|nr:hypothetical protein EDD37DRAFT_612880 [Exophiala viscosa]